MTEVEIARAELIKALEDQQKMMLLYSRFAPKFVLALERFIDAKLDPAGNLE